MGLKLSTMVMNRKNLCDLVAGATRIQSAGVGSSLGDYLSPVLAEGETLPDVAAPLELFSRRLMSYCDAMVETDAAHFAELAGFVELRERRGAVTASLKEKILSLRSTCRGLLGETSLRPLGLDFNLPQNARGVLRLAEIVRDRLLSGEHELLPSRWVAGPLDREQLAQVFEEEIAELRSVLEQLIDRQREVDLAVVAKKKAIETFDRQSVPIAQVLEASFRVAGHAELADRIRPTVRQLRRIAREDQQPAEPETSSETSPGAPPDAEPSDGTAAGGAPVSEAVELRSAA